MAAESTVAQKALAALGSDGVKTVAERLDEEAAQVRTLHSPQRPEELNASHYGYGFDVRPKRSVNIIAIHAGSYTNSNPKATVYMCQGSFRDHGNDPAAWKKVSDAVPLQQKKATRMVLTQPQNVPADSVCGFLVHSPDSSSGVGFSSSDADAPHIRCQDDGVQMLDGTLFHSATPCRSMHTTRKYRFCGVLEYQYAPGFAATVRLLRDVCTSHAEQCQEIAQLRAQLQGTQGEAARQAEEREQAGAAAGDPTAHYDIVVKVDDFPMLLDADRGWPMLVAPRAALGDGGMLQWQGVIATVLGDFNKGKTWLLGQLTDAAFPSGDVVHTPGLCARAMSVAKKHLVVLDTRGMNSPVQAVSDEALRAKKAEEGFSRDVVFDMSDAFIYLVGSLTAKEQLELYRLSRDMKRRGKALGRVIVVHNLRNIRTAEDLDGAWREITAVFTPGCEEMEEEITIGAGAETIRYLEGFPATKGETQSGYLEFQRHFILGAEHTPAGRLNAYVIEKIRRMLLDASPANRAFDFRKSLQRAMAAALPTYVTGPATVQIRADTIVAVPEGHDDSPASAGQAPQLTLRNIDLGSFVGVNSGGQSKLAPCSVFDGPEEVRAFIELPGVKQEDLAREGWCDIEPVPSGAKVHLSLRKPEPVQAPFKECEGGTAAYGEIDEWVEVTGTFDHAAEDAEMVYNGGVLCLTWRKKLQRRKTRTLGCAPAAPAAPQYADPQPPTRDVGPFRAAGAPPPPPPPRHQSFTPPPPPRRLGAVVSDTAMP